MSLVPALLRALRAALRSRTDLTLENLALRQQLALLRHQSKRRNSSRSWASLIKDLTAVRSSLVPSGLGFELDSGIRVIVEYYTFNGDAVIYCDPLDVDNAVEGLGFFDHVEKPRRKQVSPLPEGTNVVTNGSKATDDGDVEALVRQETHRTPLAPVREHDDLMGDRIGGVPQHRLDVFTRQARVRVKEVGLAYAI